MNALWTYVDSKDWSGNKKSAVVLSILGIIFALTGFIVWLVISPWTLSTPDWMICFIGYPVYFSWIIAFLYSCRHEFQNITYYHLSFDEE